MLMTKWQSDQIDYIGKLLFPTILTALVNNNFSYLGDHFKIY